MNSLEREGADCSCFSYEKCVCVVALLDERILVNTLTKYNE